MTASATLLEVKFSIEPINFISRPAGDALSNIWLKACTNDAVVPSPSEMLCVRFG